MDFSVVNLCRYLLMLSITLLYSSITSAQLGQNLFTANAKAMSLANAVTADPPGIDSIHFNPAGITRLEARQYALKLATADFDLTGKFTSTPEYDRILADNNFTDEYKNSESTANGVSVMLPGAGVVDLPVVIAPTGGLSYQMPHSDLTFATSAYGLLTLGFNRDEDDPGRFSGKTMSLNRMAYLTPTIGWQINDSLAFGVGVGLSYMGVALDLDMRVPNMATALIKRFSDLSCENISNPIIDLCQGSIGPTAPLANVNITLEETLSSTFNLGLLWTPTQWIAFGMVYQSGAKDKLQGDYEITFNPEVSSYLQGLNNSVEENLSFLIPILRTAGFPDNNNVVLERGTATANIPYPQHIAFGTSIQATPRWKVNFDIKWTDTGVWDEWDIQFSDDIEILELLGYLDNNLRKDGLTLPRGYNSTWSWALGMEYRWSDQLTLRAGYEPRPSAIPDDKMDFIIPWAEAKLYAGGFNYRIDANSFIDFAAGYISSTQNIPSGTSTNANDTSSTFLVYAPYAGLDVKTKLAVSVLLINYQKVF